MDIYQFDHSVKTTNDFVDSIKKQLYFEGIIEVPFRVNLSDYNKDVELYFRKIFYFHSPTNYTTVASRQINPEDGRAEFFINDGQQLDFHSNHDSCWRDGFERAFRNWIEFIGDYVSEKYPEHKFHIHFSHSFGVKFLENASLKIDRSEDYFKPKCYYVKNKS